MPQRSAPVERFGKPSGPDVLLLVGSASNHHAFILSESILRQLGPRWGSLLSSTSTLNGRCKRWLRNKIVTLNLRDDRPDAIRILLLIATLQFDKLPKKLDFFDLVHLTDVAVRYDAHSLLAGQMDGWLAPYRDKLQKRGYEEWLYIAQEFGYQAEYEELVGFLAMECEVDSSGKQLMRSGCSSALGGRIPIATLVHIRELRRRRLLDLLQAAYALWTDYSRGMHCRHVKGDEGIRQHCAAMNLFSLTAFLRELGLFPMLRTVTAIHASPKAFSMKLSNVSNTIHARHTSGTHRRHSAPLEEAALHARCHFSFKLNTKVSTMMHDVSWPSGITKLWSEDIGSEYRFVPT